MALPPENELWSALRRRDAALDGAFVFAVKTTGVFCRPSCGARAPKRENVAFYVEPRAALDAGYRPCRRCAPLAPPGETPAFAAVALALSDAGLDRRLGAPDLRAEGLAPARVTRWFKARTGLTFQAYHRARRMGVALAELKRGGRPSAATYALGYASDAGFRDAFAGVFGAPPARAGREATAFYARRLPTPLGEMLALADDAGVRLLEFTDRRGLPKEIADLRSKFSAAVIPGSNAALDLLARELDAYFAGRLKAFRTPVVLDGSEFERAAWDELRRIPYGAVRSYAEQARRAGRPAAVRAIGRANGRNKIAIVVPCHRVQGSDGRPVGYAGGIWRKERLLELERAGSQRSV